MVAWDKFGPTLEDVAVLTSLPIFGESRAIAMPGDSEVQLDLESEIRLVLLNETLSDSKHKGKTTYNILVSYFTEGPGTASEVVLEAMLAFWLSWYVLPSGPEDGINSYVFPLVIRLAKGEKVALAPIFLVLFFIGWTSAFRV